MKSAKETKMTLADELREAAEAWEYTDAPALTCLRRAAAALEAKDEALLAVVDALKKRQLFGDLMAAFDKADAALALGQEGAK